MFNNFADDKDDVDEYPLPPWALYRNNGEYMRLGAQLCTRDGRRVGNGFIDDFEVVDKVLLAKVVTDMGNVFYMTKNELKETFYPPKFIVNLEEFREKWQ